MDIKNLLIICIIGALTAYCLFLGNNELAGTGIGALAGVLMQQNMKGASYETGSVGNTATANSGV